MNLFVLAPKNSLLLASRKASLLTFGLWCAFNSSLTHAAPTPTSTPLPCRDAEFASYGWKRPAPATPGVGGAMGRHGANRVVATASNSYGFCSGTFTSGDYYLGTKYKNPGEINPTHPGENPNLNKPTFYLGLQQSGKTTKNFVDVEAGGQLEATQIGGVQSGWSTFMRITARHDVGGAMHQCSLWLPTDPLQSGLNNRPGWASGSAVSCSLEIRPNGNMTAQIGGQNSYNSGNGAMLGDAITGSVTMRRNIGLTQKSGSGVYVDKSWMHNFQFSQGKARLFGSSNDILWPASTSTYAPQDANEGKKRHQVNTEANHPDCHTAFPNEDAPLFQVDSGIPWSRLPDGTALATSFEQAESVYIHLMSKGVKVKGKPKSGKGTG